jgi:hypothetical protein
MSFVSRQILCKTLVATIIISSLLHYEFEYGFRYTAVLQEFLGVAVVLIKN